MSVWLALWIVFSLLLLAFLGWSLWISYQQKKVWKNFAEKNKLRYKSISFLQTPEMDGVIEGFRFNFFGSEHASKDLRSTRKMTAIEVTLSSSLPINGGCASGSMVDVLKLFGFKAEIRPEIEGWNKTYLIAGTHKRVLEMYFTLERTSLLARVMKIKNLWMIFLFADGKTLLRIDTSNPLVSSEQLEKLTKILLSAVQALELKNGEGKLLKAEESKAVLHEKSLVVDEKTLEQSFGLELEEDEVPQHKPENTQDQ